MHGRATTEERRPASVDHRSEDCDHAETDDVFVILEGSTTLMVGGALDGPTLSAPGEWKGTGIRDGKELTLNKGDVAFIPRGTPHRRTTPNQEVTLMVIKATTAR